MPIKSFRGSMSTTAGPAAPVQTLSLRTNDGKTGYKIKKLQIIVTDPYVAATKLIFKIYSVPQTTTDGIVDFSDQTLLGVSTYHDQPVAEDMAESKTIIFDNIVFNQDIYLTCHDQGLNQKSASYYIELETVKLDLNENTVATLKDIRNIKS
jgi:hypothetical protein